MKSNISHNIKHRLPKEQVDLFNNRIENSINDDFYTPVELAKKCINMIDFSTGDLVLDNAKGKGVFYNNYPDIIEKEWCEIKEDKDFLKRLEKVDWIVTNPPYSDMDKWLERSCYLCRKGFGYLIAVHNLTPKRIELCEKAGFRITKIHLCKVFKWYGISAFVVFEKKDNSILSYDRIVWR